MKQKLLFLCVLLSFGMMETGFSQECVVPGNYIQNPNMEHNLNPIFWYGSWDWAYMHVATHPEYWLTDTTEAHSGNQCMVITYNSWIWPTVTCVGFEEKDMKMSFWYKSPVGNMAFWMFFYRDALLTPEEIRPPLKEYLVGADTAYITWETSGEDVHEESLYFEMWGPYPDWTYFEFKFTYPGSIPEPWVTLMFWSEYTPGFVDDIYYGLDYDCVYNGEEEIELKNPDFEASTLGLEWLINAMAWDNVEVVATNQNHTVNGMQSLSLWGDWNSTYYSPALGTSGENMALNFWHKGHDGSLDLFVYEDYNLTPSDFPVPDGAKLLAREYIVDTTDIEVSTTVIYDTSNVISSDTANLLTILKPLSVGSEDFNNVSGAPALMDWNWSGANYFGYNDWPGQITDQESYSAPKSLWLPGDPGWSGAEGTLPGIVDSGAYSLSFMYKGKIQLVMKIGSSLKYDLKGDPDGILPAEAVVSENGSEVTWNLESDEWDYFSFAWEVGTWLADSGVTSPAGLVFDLVGTYTEGDVGYVDNLEFAEVVVPVDVLAQQDFDGLDGDKPEPMDWNWSGANFFGYNDWDGEMVETESYSAPTSFWLPGDPGWSGSEGIINGIIDSTAYSVSFMYKGKLQFILDLGDLKYDLVTDPDKIIPPEASVDGSTLLWNLSSIGWKKFSYAWEQDSWLADSSAATPADMNFSFVGTYTAGDNGYVDDLVILKSKEKLGADSLIEPSMVIYDIYAIDTILYDTTFTIETFFNDTIVDKDSDLEPLAIHFTLPAAAEWTQFNYNWTNPAGDIGSTLTFILNAGEKTATDSIIYFDDFSYGIVTSVPERVTDNSMHLYPNPVADVLHLSMQDPLSRADIYSSTGQMVKSFDNPGRSINVSGLPSGIYMIIVTDQRGNAYKSKFVKR